MSATQRKVAGFAVLALIAGFALGKLAFGVLITPDETPSSGQASLDLQSRPSLIGGRGTASQSPSLGSVPALLEGALSEEAAWLDKIGNATLATLPDLFAEADQIKGESLRSQVHHLLLIRWLDLDPEDAYAAARSRKEANIATGKPESVDETLREFFRVWSRVDLAAALAAAAALADAAESNAAHQAIARGRSEIDDPLDYLEFVKSLPGGAASSDLYASALTRLAETDRELAVTEAIELPWGPRTGSLNALYAQWSADDPHAALEGTAKLHGIGVPVHDRAIAAVLPELAKSDPDLAGEKYNNLHAPGLNRGKVLYDIVNALADEDPVAAARWLSTHGERNFTHVIADRLNQMLLTDPAVAVDMYNAVQPGEGRAFVNVQTVGNPEAVLSSIAAVPDSYGKQQLQAGLISQWASRDFHAAAAYAETLPPGDSLYRNPSDLNAAWDHAAARGGELSDGIFQSLLRTIADADPDLAIRKFQTLPPGDFRDAAGRRLTSTLARSDPFKAAEMLDVLPDGDVRDDAIRTVSNRLAADDPFAASEWIANFPAGNERDIASIELVSIVQDFDSRSAFVWAADIGNEASRNQSLERIVRVWSRTDPAAAANEINVSAIPDAQKKNLLRILNAN